MQDNIGTFPISSTFMLPLSYNRLLVIGTDGWRSVPTNNYLFSPSKHLIVYSHVQYQILYHEYQAYKWSTQTLWRGYCPQASTRPITYYSFPKCSLFEGTWPEESKKCLMCSKTTKQNRVDWRLRGCTAGYSDFNNLMGFTSKKLPYNILYNVFKKFFNRLKGQCHEIFCFRFFSWIIFPQAPEITLGSFWIFLKIRREIRKSRCTTAVNDTGGKIAAGIKDTGGKFATGIIDTSGKFCLCCWHRWQICHRCQLYRWQICRSCQWCRWLVATGINDTVANLPPMSLTPLANNGNNIRLQTPWSDLEGKNSYIC